jgi:membrane protease YdiL (CAAX protease family)
LHGLLLVVLGTLAIVVTIALTSVEPATESAPILIISVAASSTILVVAALLFGPRRHGVPLSALGLRPWGAGQLVLPLAVFAAIIIFNGAYGAVVTELGWDVLIPPDRPFEPDFQPSQLVLLGLLIIGVGPMAEEVFFRGFIMSGLARSLGPRGGVLLSALIFSLAHVDPAVYLPIFVAGVLLAWLYMKTGSLLACFFAHGAQNAVAFAVIVAT